MDPLRLPSSGETPNAHFAHAQGLGGTPGQAYIEHRAIALSVAEAAGVRFDPDWEGRPAVLVALHNDHDTLVSVHGRYLSTLRGQDKMLTVGPGEGVICVGEGWHADPLILVEGLFDALSLAVCGFSSVATIGRWAPWLAQVCAGREVWLGFDGNQPGEHEALRYSRRLPDATVRRLVPPDRCKDWNTALCKRGRADVARWVRGRLGCTTAP
ncbi:toprim domain-containing protein [Variovorax sp. J22R133]|uniref:toprim domain-containing protein n=1 Tax=Variovorax brevis TaxID=3053503 RepID=UPI0025772D5B|nr:toprim domain-containing protein [Variovorax sp. J22R133]MDM0110672.1 toprim domain-containing protein [Variovorax sp. J22R133]